MSLLSKTPVNNQQKKFRIPNAFMLFVKEQKNDLVKKCPPQSKSELGSFLGKKWKSLSSTEKQVYYDKYNTLKKMTRENSENLQVSEEDGQHDHNQPIDELSPQFQRNIPQKKNLRNGTDDILASNGETKSEKSYCEASLKENGVSHENNGISPETDCIPKELKSKKKPLNAFMIFANEQRKKLSQANPKGKQSHLSRILGDMWKQLQATDKEKYFSEARRLGALHRDKYQGLSCKVGDIGNKLKGKPYMKIKVIKSRKLNKKPKERFSKRISLRVQSPKESSVPERKKEIVPKPPKVHTNVSGEQSRISETQAALDPPNMNLYATTSAGPSFHPGPSSSSTSSISLCRHSAAQWLPDYNKSACNQLFPASYGGMNNACCGGGQYPFIPPYQMSDPALWMYRQAFGLHPCHFAPHMSSGYPYYNGSFPYFPYPGSQFNAYFAERCCGQYPCLPRIGNFFGNNSRRDDSVVIEPSNSSGSISGKHDGAAEEPVYSGGGNQENTIKIESVCSTAGQSSKTDDDNETVEHKKDDEDSSLGSDALVIVDDEENEGREDPDVNEH